MGELLPVDLEQFWKDDEQAHKENCFFEKSPQVALGIRMARECVFHELGLKGELWGVLPGEEQKRLNKMYNDKAEEIVGIRLLEEEFLPEDAHFPYVKRIGEIFGGTYDYSPLAGEWLYSDIKTAKELEERLDIVDKMDIREFVLPTNWEKEKKRIFETYGIRPNPVHSVRGPVTLAMSIFGVEELIYLYYDAPELYKRFSHTIKNAILEYSKVMDIEAGFDESCRPHGFSFFDDNCCMLTPEMYEEFGYPVLKEVFEYYSPNEGDERYQHSDSAMEHLLPILGSLNLTACNFGPTVLVDKIRKYMPKTRIDGCLAPFTFMNDNKDEIIAEVKRDCEMIKASGTKGLNISTAGSTNNGSTLEGMRAVMFAIQNYGRY